MKKLIALFIVSLGLTSTFAENRVDLMRENMAKLQSYSTDFVQTRKVSALQDEFKFTGSLKVNGSDLCWNIQEPLNSATYVIGGRVFQYEDGVLVQSNRMSARILSEIKSIISGDFTKNGMYFEEKTDSKIVLTPKNELARNFISKIEITVAKEANFPQKIEIFSPNGDSNKIEFTKFNPEFKDKISLPQ